MKNNYKIISRLFLPFAIALFLSPNVSVGQSIIYSLSPQQSEFSIVRHYKEEIDITYSWYLSDVNCFCYIDRLNNVYYKADVDLNLKDYDCRIYNDYVYFCGLYGSTSAIGWFKISGLFFQGSGLNIVSMPINISTYPYASGNDISITGRRLKVFEKNGDLHLVMVGSGEHIVYDEKAIDTADRISYNTYSAIIDIWTNNYSQWDMRYTMDYSDLMSYDDIAVTENYVVVTAHFTNPYNNYLSPHVLYYPLPTISGQSIFGLFTLPGPIYASGYFTEYDFIHCQAGTPLLISEIGGDKFVTACDAVILNSYPSTVVTYYQDPISWPTARYLYDPQTPGIYSEIRYNLQNDFLYLFRRSDYIERIGAPFYFANIYKVVNNLFYSGQSMDVLDRGGSVILSSTNMSGIKTLWKFDESNPNACVTETDVPVETKNEVRGGCPKEQYVNKAFYYSDWLRADVTTNGIRIVCE